MAARKRRGALHLLQRRYRQHRSANPPRPAVCEERGLPRDRIHLRRQAALRRARGLRLRACKAHPDNARRRREPHYPPPCRRPHTGDPVLHTRDKGARPCTRTRWLPLSMWTAPRHRGDDGVPPVRH